MLKILLASLLFSSQVFAGLPPTTLKGQTPTAKPTTFNFETPYNQATTTAAATGLIETGNKNLLVNPSLEHQTAGSGWTSGTGTVATIETTNIHDGKRSAQLTMTATNGLSFYQDVTPTIQMSGVNLEYSIWVKNTNTVTNLQVCARQAGATVGTCLTASVDPGWKQYVINYPGPASGSVGIAVQTTQANSGTVQVDEAYIGPARNIGTVADQNNFTAKVSSAGVVSASTGNPSTWITCTSAAPYTCTFVAGIFTASPNCLATVTTNSYAGYIYNQTSASMIVDTFNTTTTTRVNEGFNLNCTKSGSNYIQTAIRIDQSNTNWTRCDSTPTAMGTVTGIKMFSKRTGQNLEMQGEFISGTATGSTFTIPTCFGGVAASVTVDTSVTSTVVNNVMGQFAQDQGGTNQFQILAPSSNQAYVNVGIQNTGLAGVSPVTGSAIGGGGAKYSFKFSVPIVGWTENQNAPLLIGGVTSSSGGLTKIENIQMSGITCTSSPCGVTYSSVSGTTVTRSGTGGYTVNWGTSWANANYSCSLTSLNNAAAAFGLISSKSNSNFTIVSIKPSNEQVIDAAYDIICTGPL